MNENRYAPPKAAVDDCVSPLAEQSAVGLPALRLATRLLWGSIALALLVTALAWNALTANTPTGRVLPFLAFAYAVLMFLIYNVGRARNWARIVILIFVVLGLPSLRNLPATFERTPVIASVYVVQTLIQLTALGMMFFGSARHAFRKRKRP
ncbi:MAG TPA: hypothetical protein VJS12_02775 [Steroidobacteraceae bacterium]|nr:hypothetical protein [Steroidobacteraceae bacterium]